MGFNYTEMNPSYTQVQLCVCDIGLILQKVAQYSVNKLSCIHLLRIEIKLIYSTTKKNDGKYKFVLY